MNLSPKCMIKVKRFNERVVVSQARIVMFLPDSYLLRWLSL